jgi:hypothetical protein
LFVVTLAVGTATVAAISLSPLYARRVHLVRSSRLGTGLVIVALALGALSLATSGYAVASKDELFLCLFGVLLLGTLLILGEDPDERGGGPDGLGENPEGDPPWWPEFEADFSSYARRPRSPVTTR